MNVQELRHTLAGVDAEAPALVRCDGHLREIETVQTRIIADGDQRPRKVFVLIVADGPSDVQSEPSTTLRSPRS